MKNLSVICIIFVGVILVSGCTGGEKTSSETSPGSPTTQQSDTQNHDLILKLSDLPEGFELGSNSGGHSDNYAITKSCSWKSPGIFIASNNSQGCKFTHYKDSKDNLPIGYRFVGGAFGYLDPSPRFPLNHQRQIVVDYKIFDTSDGLRESIDQLKTAMDYQAKKQGLDIKMGNPNIGEYSLWITGNMTDNPDIIDTVISFADKNSLVEIRVVDEKDKSFNEAIKIAKVVDSRL